MIRTEMCKKLNRLFHHANILKINNTKQMTVNYIDVYDYLVKISHSEKIADLLVAICTVGTFDNPLQIIEQVDNSQIYIFNAHQHTHMLTKLIRMTCNNINVLEASIEDVENYLKNMNQLWEKSKMVLPYYYDGVRHTLIFVKKCPHVESFSDEFLKKICYIDFHEYASKCEKEQNVDMLSENEFIEYKNGFEQLMKIQKQMWTLKLNIDRT